ncbi:ATP-binding protein [Mesorhizobium australicum]|uniref:ATP-binding protein n=1 Tax=Mesorhizobium australicum TaxID=536018 RepID=UPI00333CE4E1
MAISYLRIVLANSSTRSRPLKSLLFFGDKNNRLSPCPDRAANGADLIHSSIDTATAILDRLLHHCSVITIRSDSYPSVKSVVPGVLQKPGMMPEQTTATANQRGSQFFMSPMEGSTPGVT